MKRYEIGIAIPNYNNAQFLEECIESIKSQTYKVTQILVVDDCSTDNSIEILENLSKKYENFTYKKNEKNMGVSYTRDRALRLLETEYVSAIDSDDFYYNKKKLENEISLIKKFKEEYNEDIVAYSNIISTDIDGKFQKKNISKHNQCNGECFEKFITREVRIPTCSLYSKSLFKQLDGFDTTIPLYEDWDFKIRLSKIAKFYYTDEDGFAYRHHNFGLSSAKRKEHKKWLSYVFEKNISKVKNQAKLRTKFLNNMNPTILRRVINKLKRIIKKWALLRLN